MTVETQAIHPGGGWHNLTWNFAITSAISNSYSRLVVFPDYGNQNNNNNLFYIDDIDVLEVMTESLRIVNIFLLVFMRQMQHLWTFSQA